MKNQVTSIEQSRRLIELGVPADKAGMCWVRDPNEGDYNLCVHDKYCYEVAALEPRPAFTVADLLEMMPSNIADVGGLCEDYSLTLSCCFCWKLRYEDNRTHQHIGDELGFDLVALLCNRIEWLLSNGYKLEV